MSRDRVIHPLLFEQREQRLATLDALPRNLWLGSMINSQGSLEPRLRALQGLREALLGGGAPAPESAHWPDRALAAALHSAFLRLELPRFCRDRSELTDQVLSSMLWHLDRIVDHVDRGDSAEAARQKAVDAFAEEWKERCDLLDDLEAVLGVTEAIAKNTDWDLLRGLLRSEGWQEIVRIRGMLEALPELAALIQRLGRMQPVEIADEVNRPEPQQMEQSTEARSSVHFTRIPEMPGETRTICRSGRITRMLPSETMLLTHRRLRLVWHAHHAERTLLTYEDDERIPVAVRERVSVRLPSAARKPDRRLEAGPMLICVDTSGSMQGGAEAVAKAVVLEAVRAANALNRACYVFAFGGPDEIVELELSPHATGIGNLVQFFSQGFHGGTDICGPLERVLARLAEQRWRRADLLIASDGEFGATRETAAAVARAKAELGLKVQGVLIGDRETIGFLEVADDIFWVRDWRRFGGPATDSPVHSSSLTALYFPGALRSGRQDATMGGEEASQAVRRGWRGKSS
ncbi:MAG: VWA domain-containing protein [Gemmatimonadota bacterium]